MLQFGHQMEQLLCGKIRHVITVPHRALVDEYLKLCTYSLSRALTTTHPLAPPQVSIQSPTPRRVCVSA